MGHLRDILYTSTYIYLFPPTQQEKTNRKIIIWWQSAGNLRQFAAFYYILPSPLNPIKFC